MSAALNAHKITISLCIVDCKSRENVRLSVSHKSQFNGYATLLCSGSMIPDTNLGGKIATINEVSDDQKATFFFS